jgi:hypothetical protein
MKRWLLPWLGLVAALTSPAARAEEQKKRPLPDYDGRGGPHQTPGQKALWVPRILLSPLYFVSEFVIRRPLGAAITAAEKAELPTALYDFFAFGPDHKAGVVPIAFLEFGFKPSVGLYAFWDDAGFKGHQLRLRGSTWGASWLSGTATERFVFSERSDITLNATATRRPDYAFFGIGPDSHQNDMMRYRADWVDARAEVRTGFWSSSMLEAGAGYRGYSFHDTDFGADKRGTDDYEPSVAEEARAGRIPYPPGFLDGYRAPFGRGRLILDSRNPKGSATGVRVELTGEQGVDLKNSPSSGWLRYSGSLGAFLDLGDSGRVIGLSLTTIMSDQLGQRPVPLTELVTLGGTDLMPGFRPGRLYDRSAVVATLRYSWPIWIWLNGSLQGSVGNVFGEHLSGFRAERNRLSGALGIESNASRDSVFQAVIGFGSETFESGGKIDSLRIAVGARRGF